MSCGWAIVFGREVRTLSFFDIVLQDPINYQNYEATRSSQTHDAAADTSFTGALSGDCLSKITPLEEGEHE